MPIYRPAWLILRVALGLIAFGNGLLVTQAVARGDAADAAWAAVRAAVPSGVPIYRPIWLPDGFRMAPSVVNGTFYGIVYSRDGGGLLVFTFNSGNSSPATSVEAITIHGVPANLVTTDGSPPLGVFWREAEVSYAVRVEGGAPAKVSRDELLQVVASLAPVGPDGKVITPGMPNTGGGRTLRPFSGSLWSSGVWVLLLAALSLVWATRRRA